MNFLVKMWEKVGFIVLFVIGVFRSLLIYKFILLRLLYRFISLDLSLFGMFFLFMLKWFLNLIYGGRLWFLFCWIFIVIRLVVIFGLGFNFIVNVYEKNFLNKYSIFLNKYNIFLKVEKGWEIYYRLSWGIGFLNYICYKF